MKFCKFAFLFLVILLIPSAARAQKPEITISLNEQFFDAVIDAILRAAPPPEFSLAVSGTKKRNDVGAPGFLSEIEGEGFIKAAFDPAGYTTPRESCRESIRLMPESGSVRTAVRFRDGKIFAPLAFTGSYNPPLVGCVDFSGWAESIVELQFDEANQRLIARARVLNVSLNGTGGVGGSIIARMVQNSIDKKINPIEIFQLEKVSFLLPIQNSGKLRMKAVGIRHEIADGRLDVHVAYEFEKG